MELIDQLRDTFPDAARDTKLNLSQVLQPGHLSETQMWGVAVASAVAARSPALTKALVETARAKFGDPLVDDAFASATLMAMNNVYYRFRHHVGKETYSQKPARLRMNRLVKTNGPKADFELMSLAVSAINGCEACVKAHEKTALEHGLNEEQVHDAVRIAAAIHAAAVSAELAGLLPQAPQ